MRRSLTSEGFLYADIEYLIETRCKNNPNFKRVIETSNWWKEWQSHWGYLDDYIKTGRTKSLDILLSQNSEFHEAYKMYWQNMRGIK